MIFALFACAVVLQQSSPTTPIVVPKPPAKKPAPSKKKPTTVKRSAIGEKPAPKQSPPVVVIKPDFVDKPAGTGEPVKTGDLVTIHFLVERRNGQDLADSKKRGLPYTFKIGAKGNDPLLDFVVKGMKSGGTRVATVLASSIYGPVGSPPIISGKDVLVVTINLLQRGSK